MLPNIFVFLVNSFQVYNYDVSFHEQTKAELAISQLFHSRLMLRSQNTVILLLQVDSRCTMK